MFLNKRRNRVKLMYWDSDGIAIWMKRLDAVILNDHFVHPTASMSSWSVPNCIPILSGIELTDCQKTVALCGSGCTQRLVTTPQHAQTFWCFWTQ